MLILHSKVVIKRTHLSYNYFFCASRLLYDESVSCIYETKSIYISRMKQNGRNLLPWGKNLIPKELDNTSSYIVPTIVFNLTFVYMSLMTGNGSKTYFSNDSHSGFPVITCPRSPSRWNCTVLTVR